MKKVAMAAQMLQKRIAHADHISTGIPSERQLADEMGLSRPTVRTAVQMLIDQGVLTRLANGRLEVAAQAQGSGPLTIGFVTPAIHSAQVEQLRHGVEESLKGQRVTLRPVTYGHWADPVLQEVLSGFDGAFFVPPLEKIPTWLVAKIKSSSCRVAVLNQDESADGLPSVLTFPQAPESKLLEHLYQLGHRKIDCINTQDEDAIIRGRIAAWQGYLKSKRLSGQLRELEEKNPIPSAYRLITQALQADDFTATALFCTTAPAAMGAMRAFHDAGLRVGPDVSVCAVNGEGMEQYMLPSLTSLESPLISLHLGKISEWLLQKSDWQGPLLVRPDDVPLFEGESTAPAPRSAKPNPVQSQKEKLPI